MPATTARPDLMLTFPWVDRAPPLLFVVHFFDLLPSNSLGCHFPHSKVGTFEDEPYFSWHIRRVLWKKTKSIHVPDHIKETPKRAASVVEKILQVLSITFVITYISGYLVTSTFLNSYGIAADTSEFLKARYLYVATYLLFLASVGMAFGFATVS